MQLYLQCQYRVPSTNVETLVTSGQLNVEEMLAFVADLQKTGRVRNITITDTYDSSWTVKQLRAYCEELQQQPHDVVVYFDGGFQQGEAGLGAVVYYKANERMRVRKNRLAYDIMTNNEAEYAALYEALRIVEELRVTGQPIIVRGDSKVVLTQMSGDWAVHDKACERWVQKIDALIARINVTVQYEHIARAHNSEAHTLATQALQRVEVEAHAPHKTKRQQRRTKHD